MKGYALSEWYICPVCGSEIPYDEDVYIDEDMTVLGCRCCVAVSSAYLYCGELEE